jgi:hypothetical protein
MRAILERVRPSLEVPFLVNVLRIDYKASFDLAKEFDALGIWQDLLVDKAIPMNFERHLVLEPDPRGLKGIKRG